MYRSTDSMPGVVGFPHDCVMSPVTGSLGWFSRGRSDAVDQIINTGVHRVIPIGVRGATVEVGNSTEVIPSMSWMTQNWRCSLRCTTSYNWAASGRRRIVRLRQAIAVPRKTRRHAEGFHGHTGRGPGGGIVLQEDFIGVRVQLKQAHIATHNLPTNPAIRNMPSSVPFWWSEFLLQSTRR